jgi:DHA1 family bicyclomycin/chloramphenicol resistance-like MFS transporter
VSSKTGEALIAFRFLQALGGCVAQVSSIAMVRDFFPEKERAKVFSMLMLIVGVSPLFAPTVGGFITTWFGWQWVFILLAFIVLAVLLVCYFVLPEGHEPDPTVSLKVAPILENFRSIMQHPQFYTYALSGAFSFAGLLVYVAGSPIIFMGIFHVSAEVYGGIFALLSVGFVCGSQVNIQLAKRFRTENIYLGALAGQAAVGCLFLSAALLAPPGLNTTVALLALYLSFLGVTYPNASALALAPFGRNAGSASALMGSLQIGIAALASAGVGIFDSSHSLPIVTLLMATATIGLILLIFGKRKMLQEDENLAPAITSL